MTNSKEFLGSDEAAQENNAGDQQQQVSEAESKESQEATQATFSELVGEGKRYTDPESLAKAKLEADTHIKTVEEENAELRKRVDSMSNNYEKILSKLEQSNSESVSVKTKDAEGAENNQPSSNFNQDIEALLESKLSEREKRQVVEANKAKSKDLIVQTYGNYATASKVLDDLFNNKPYLASTMEYLRDNDPETFVKEVTAYMSPQSIGNVSVDPVTSTPAGRLDANAQHIPWSEAKKVMKRDIKKYTSQEFQDVIKKSEAYYKSQGRDYYNT